MEPLAAALRTPRAARDSAVVSDSASRGGRGGLWSRELEEPGPRATLGSRGVLAPVVGVEGRGRVEAHGRVRLEREPRPEALAAWVLVPARDEPLAQAVRQRLHLRAAAAHLAVTLGPPRFQAGSAREGPHVLSGRRARRLLAGEGVHAACRGLPRVKVHPPLPRRLRLLRLLTCCARRRVSTPGPRARRVHAVREREGRSGTEGVEEGGRVSARPRGLHHMQFLRRGGDPA